MRDLNTLFTPDRMKFSSRRSSAGNLSARRALCLRTERTPIMKQIFPVILALIPLAAVVGACVTGP